MNNVNDKKEWSIEGTESDPFEPPSTIAAGYSWVPSQIFNEKATWTLRRKTPHINNIMLKENTSLRGINYINVVFDNCILNKTFWQNSCLIMCVFNNCQLEDAIFNGAILRGVKFNNVSFSLITINSIKEANNASIGITINGKSFANLPILTKKGEGK